jgi:hypothetical protein
LYGCETWSLKVKLEQRLRVFKNTVLWRIFGPRRDWGKVRNVELHNLYNTRMKKPRKLIWARNGVRYKCWLESLNGRDSLEDTSVDGRIILKWILKKLCYKVWIGLL